MKVKILSNEFFTIVIDREVIAEYGKYYFSLPENSKKRKFYFMNNWKTKKKKPKLLYCTLSLNDLLPMNSQMYGNLKNQWKMLGLWLAKKNNVGNLQLTNCVVDVIWYQETRAHRDFDNQYGGLKLLLDPLLVGSGFFIDDDSRHMSVLIGDLRYDKEHPRMVLRITPCGELKTRKEKLDLHFSIFE